MASQLTNVFDHESAYTYGYDQLGRLATIDNLGTASMPQVSLSHVFDAAGNRILQTATIGGVMDFRNDYTHDLLGRVTKIEQKQQTGNAVAPKRVDFEYNAASQFTDVSRYSDLAGTSLIAAGAYSYDGIGRMTSLAYTKSGGSSITTFGYNWDEANRITDFTNSAYGAEDATYDYDEAGQVTGADRSGTSDDEDYDYDHTGNRDTGYSTGAANRLLSDGEYTYTYDDEGNRLTKTKSGESTTYTWDHRNRLTGVTIVDGSGTRVITYKYDVSNQLISRSESLNGGAATVERHIYDGQQIVLSFNGSNQLTDRNLWGPQVDQLLFQEQVSSTSSPGTLYTAITDHLQSVREIVNTSGTSVGHNNFDSFGRLVSSTGITLPFAYTGKLLDGSTGLQYNWHRWYDATVGKWISEDPIGFGDGLNVYAYVRNNPITFRDFNGLAADSTDDFPEEYYYNVLRELAEEWRNDNHWPLAADLLEQFLKRKGATDPHEEFRFDQHWGRIYGDKDFKSFVDTALANHVSVHIPSDVSTRRLRLPDSETYTYSFSSGELFYAFGGVRLKFKDIVVSVVPGKEAGTCTWEATATARLVDSYSFPPGFLGSRLIFPSYRLAFYLESIYDYLRYRAVVEAPMHVRGDVGITGPP